MPRSSTSSRFDRLLRCSSYHGPAVGGMPLVDDGTLTPLLTVERCRRCQKRYTVQYNIGSWECRGHPGFYQGRAGTHSSFPISPHGPGTWSCCGQTANPHAPGYDKGGCTAQDHSPIGLEYVKDIPGSVIKVTLLELAAVPPSYRNPKAYLEQVGDGIFVARYDYETAAIRVKRGFSSAEIHNPGLRSWREIREEVSGAAAVGESRRLYGGPSNRLYTLTKQHCPVLPYRSGLRILPRMSGSRQIQKKKNKFPATW
jgi:hypothetical protein